MKRFSKLLVALSIFFFVSGASSTAESQTGSLTDVVSCQRTSLDLANMLVEVSWLSQVPIIAELAQPLPNVELSEGTYVVRDLMQAIVRQVPGYDWESKGKVLYVYNRQLRETKFNFLGIEFPTFVAPPNISELKLTFPTLVLGLLESKATGGYAISGFGDKELEKDSLRPGTLKNISGRDILIRLDNETPSFVSVIVFPNSDPTQKEMELDFNRNWFWEPLKGENSAPVYVQPPKLPPPLN